MNKTQFPTSFMGVDSEEAYERIMNEKELEQKTSPIIPNSAGKDTNNFVYVPSINLYVAKERSHLSKSWFDCHKELQSEGLRMPTLPEFIEFLKYCKINNPDIYKEITEVRSPWRSEWIDADFKVINKKLHINYHHVLDSNGNLIPKNSELLDKDVLMEDKTPGISLEDYLYNNHTSQGLPSKKVESGELYYYCPRNDNNSVAWFSANSGRADLNCGRSPSDQVPSLGVFGVAQSGL